MNRVFDYDQIEHVRSYSILIHDTTLTMAFGAIFLPILMPDPLLEDVQIGTEPIN